MSVFTTQHLEAILKLKVCQQNLRSYQIYPGRNSVPGDYPDIHRQELEAVGVRGERQVFSPFGQNFDKYKVLGRVTSGDA